MKTLVVHNFYQQPGGEDVVFEDECRLLEAHGHQVVRYTRHNDELREMGSIEMLRNTIWNRQVEAELEDLIRRERPLVMHCHNTFPLMSPAVHHAAKRQGVAVVQTLHNYRMLCPAATFLRDGSICEKCVGCSVTLPAIRHACYRGSRAASIAATAMLAVHRQQRTWTDVVDRYIALTEFARQKFIQGGLPAHRISVKPNLVQPDPGIGRHDGNHVAFVGRLSTEKGIGVLLDAWQQMSTDIDLRIAGDGPLSDRVRQAAANDSRIHWHGQLASDGVAGLIGGARLLVMPSVCYETFGRTIIEAFASGTPVVASRMGAMQELVDDGRTGLLFEPGDSADLAGKIQGLWNQHVLQEAMQLATRAEYEDGYTVQPNYEQLIEIYEQALVTAGHPVDPQTAIRI